MFIPSGSQHRAVPVTRSFEVGCHVIRVTRIAVDRWISRVDGALCGNTYASSADAWTAGVREVDRLDRGDG